MSYVNEVKDTVLDALKANLKGVTVLTSSIENVEDEYLSDHNPNQPCENSVPSTSRDESLSTDLAVDDDNFSAPIVDDEILPLALVDDDLVAVDAYFAEEVDEEMKEEKKQQDEEKVTEKEEEKMEENVEEKEEEKLEEKKRRRK
ncbi:hypothetical protein R3W88_019794 [Solanum pinnatisectum]|uniref:Uncharacterized protein n=1 Tax=Solanum pinnatisectum TaxID=50273 RepID=A0AAV9KKH7_9SOLN|nr:hypothetical protein R3W88_019794 [Solanum pinnatisectum]